VTPATHEGRPGQPAGAAADGAAPAAGLDRPVRPWWGTDAEALDNQAAADRDAALALARTNPIITSVVVHELAKM